MKRKTNTLKSRFLSLKSTLKRVDFKFIGLVIRLVIEICKLFH